MTDKKKDFSGRILDYFEKIVNKLPDPVFLFAFLAVAVIICSWIFSELGVTVTHPGTGETVAAKNLLSADQFKKMLAMAVKNFIGFPPLGIVLAALIGIGVADKSGFLAAALRYIVVYVPKKLVVPTLIFASVNASLLADAGVVIMPPLGAYIFSKLGRHPLAGLCAAFAGVVGGFSANVLITALDPLLAGFTESAAVMINPSYVVFPTANYFFMVASVALVTIAGTFVTTKIIEPRLGESSYGDIADNVESELPGDKEKRGLAWGAATFIVLLVLLAIAIIPENGFLRDENGKLFPFYRSLISLIIIFFMFSGLAFGIAAGKIKSTKDLAGMMGESMSAMGLYIVLAFMAGQFIAYFGWSNLGLITAVKGADFLKGIGLEGLPLAFGFFAFSAAINLFIASASAKWAILSPVFVPMLMLLGYSPETTQLLYRVGDSITNMVTPLLPYFPIVLVLGRKYIPDLTLGKLISTLLPYSITLFFIWGAFLLIWLGLEIPIGPDIPMFYK